MQIKCYSSGGANKTVGVAYGGAPFRHTLPAFRPNSLDVA